MNSDNAIVRPIIGRKSPKLGPLAVMVSSSGDFQRLIRALPVAEQTAVHLMMSRLYLGGNSGADGRYAIVGPVVGAPYAVMLMEPLIAWGAPGDALHGMVRRHLPPRWRSGTSSCRQGPSSTRGPPPDMAQHPWTRPVRPRQMNQRIISALAARSSKIHEGKIWSTDAIYRETPEKVAHFQSQNALAVEMELSALFTVGRYRGIQVGAVLVVSDELTTLTWKPGFKDDRFGRARRTLIEVIKDLCQNPM